MEQKKNKPGPDDYLSRLYGDPSYPGGLSGANSFLRALRASRQQSASPSSPSPGPLDGSSSRGRRAARTSAQSPASRLDNNHHHHRRRRRREDIIEWLRGQETYTLHRPARRRYPRNPYVVYGIDEQWDADLVDMTQHRADNDNYAYLLTCIDVFSKHAWVRPLRRKSGVEVAVAIEDIVSKSGRRPHRLYTDRGREFLNAEVRSALQRLGISHVASVSDVKAAVVERFNRTLKERMWRYFTNLNGSRKNNNNNNNNKGKRRYIDVVQKLVAGYNSSYHRSIGMAPVQVSPRNEAEVFERLQPQIAASNALAKKKKKYKFRLNVGDSVRLSRAKGAFEKGYVANWTREVFTVTRRIPRHPLPVYRVSGADGQPVEGSFYESELQRVDV